MFQKHGFPTLTERIDSWLKTARAAVKREEQSENPERIVERDPMDDEEIRRRFLSSPVKLRAYLQDVFGDLEESDDDESATSGDTPLSDQVERFLYDDFANSTMSSVGSMVSQQALLEDGWVLD